MGEVTLAQEIADAYRRYLEATFHFKDPELRASFSQALERSYLVKGPYLEATPRFKRGATPRALFQQLLGKPMPDAIIRSLHGDRPLYKHQEQAISQASAGKNVVVATGTGSGKTEAFLYPILLHLYLQHTAGKLASGVRALILYPMNALANDQRDRLRETAGRLKREGAPFRFTFGQYIGETPEDEKDRRRRAPELLADRERGGDSTVENGQVLHGELVLRSEMRRTPPHILLTNYSMLEYLLLRPSDSPLFDDGQATWWTFLVLDEAHQYRGHVASKWLCFCGG